LKTKENKPIPINISKMKNKAQTKPREKKKNQKTTERPSYPNKKRNRKEANLERSARESQPVSRLKPNMSGKLYLQKDDKTRKKVMFAEDKLKQLECCHNLVLQVKPEKEQIIEYGSSQAMLIA
jgi:hypothetical protein